MVMVRAMVTTLLWPSTVTSCRGRLSTNPARLRPKSSCSLRSATSTSGSDESSQTPLQPYGALLLDIGGTLLETSQPVSEVYARIGAKYELVERLIQLEKKNAKLHQVATHWEKQVKACVKAIVANIKKGFKKAFSMPWLEQLCYEGDKKPFWQYAVATTTSYLDETYFEELYQ